MRQIELETQNDELRQSQTARMESEERQRAYIENAPNLILEVNRQGIITYSNSFFPEYKFDDVVGKSFIDMTAPQFQDKIRKALDMVFSEEANQTNRSRGLGVNGEMRWFQSKVAPVKVSGNVKSAIVLVNDITGLVHIDVNSAATKITGYRKEELLSMKFSKLVPEESLEYAADHFSRLSEEGLLWENLPS